ncbi:MAG: hypothetical protein ACLU5J_05400 [Christensenellales bacterium]
MLKLQMLVIHQFIEQKDEDLANAILDSLNVPASISQTTDLDKIDGLTWELATANSNVKVEKQSNYCFIQ